MDFKFGRYIHRVHPNKSPLKFVEKMERGHNIQGLPKVFKYPIILGSGKATDFKFGRYIHSVHPNKRLLKFWRKGSVGVSRDCPSS